MAKRALQTLVRGSDGRQKLVYIDIETGEEIPYSEIEEYEVITGDGQDYWGQQVTPAKPTENKPVEETENSALKKIQDSQRQGGDRGFFDEPDTFAGLPDGGGPTNNYGWIDKPGWMNTMAGLLPGKAGLAAKGVNSAINAANLSPVNKARDLMGLDSLGFKDSLKGILKDRKGQVADVKIGDGQYSVGFKALSPEGRTNMTPQEAMLRARQNEVPIEEISPRGAVDGVKSTGDSIISKVTGLGEGWAGRLLDSIFGGRNQSKPITPAEPTVLEIAGIQPTGRADYPVDNTKRTQDLLAGRLDTSPRVAQSPVQSPTSVGFIADYGPKRPYDPDPSVINALKGTVDSELGKDYTIRGTSGKGEYGSHRHRGGGALDFDILDPSGNQVLDDVTLDNLAVALARNNPGAGIGYGAGYMTPGRMHFDLVGPANQWGAGETRANMDPILAKEIDLARRGEYMPTPTSAPRDSLDPIGEDLDPMATNAALSPEQKAAENYAQQVVQEVRREREARSFRNASPAEFAANGLIERTPDQVSRIAQALAGEMSPSQLKALEAGDPIAKRELANMVATIENRAMSKTFGSLDGALRSDQYNSLIKGNTGVTSQNYDLYRDVLSTNINDFYTGALKPDDYDFTNYHSGKVSPAWGEVMDSRTMTGDHMFGVLGRAQGDPTYDLSENFLEGRDFYSTYGDRQGFGTFGNTDSPGYGRSLLDTPSRHAMERERDTSLNGFMGRTDGSSFGTTSSPGYGRSSLESGGGGALGGTTSAHSAERERDTSLSSGGFSGGSRSSGTTSSHSAERERDYSGGSSPTNDGYSGSKTPGGGF